MLGIRVVPENRAYLADKGGYIIVFQEQAIGGGKVLSASVGTVLGGRYKVQSTLGAGGMAVVYEAEDAALGRRVALKTLYDHYAEEPSFRSRFEQEARVMASLDHENIVKVYDISEDGDVPFIVAEYVSGQDIGTMLKSAPDGRLSEQFTVEVVGQLLRALNYAHRRGVIHRDIKPSNILITQEGVVKVADFGIARVIEEEEAGDPGEIIGSARYMSPEQLKGEETTPHSDLYSVGILLYHCLTGKPPFSGNAKSVARQQIYKNPILPRKVRGKISQHLEAVILKALAKDPEDRYPSALAMLEDLERSVDTEGSERVLRRSFKSRKVLLPLSALVMLLLSGGAVAASIGYLDLGALPLLGRTEGTLTAPVQPVAEESPEAPDTRQETGQSAAENPQLLQQFAYVPDVDAYFDWYAEQTLRNAGFQPQVVYEYHEGYAPNGVTWGTDPLAGTLQPLGTTITIYATPNDQLKQPQPQPQLQQPPPQAQPQPQQQSPPQQPQPQIRS
jgi:serine/threonine-protein kinase